MKSSYELAMEKLEKSAPTQKLTKEQQAEIAELDSVYKSKIAERETFLQGEIAKAVIIGDSANLQMLQDELARDLKSIRAEWDEKKEKLRAARKG